jgi:AAA domain
MSAGQSGADGLPVGLLGERVDLTAIDVRQAPPWTPGAELLFRPEMRSIWFAPRGQGKSLAAFIVAVQVIEAGGRVVYVDLENGARRQAGRLAAILADRPASTRLAIPERLRYYPQPRFAALTSESARAAWRTQFAGADLVIVDSIARALAMLGLDEDRAADFTTFMVGHIDPIAAQGSAVLLLDNTGHEEKKRTRGSSAKLDLVEVVYKLTSTNISPKQHGTIKLERTRTRDGEEAETLTCGAGAGVYTELRSAPSRADVDASALLDHITTAPGSSVDQIATDLKRRPSNVRSELRSLAEAGSAIADTCHRTGRDGRRYSYKGWFPAPHGDASTDPTPGTVTDG